MDVSTAQGRWVLGLALYEVAILPTYRQRCKKTKQTRGLFHVSNTQAGVEVDQIAGPCGRIGAGV